MQDIHDPRSEGGASDYGEPPDGVTRHAVVQRVETVVYQTKAVREWPASEAKELRKLSSLIGSLTEEQDELLMRMQEVERHLDDRYTRLRDSMIQLVSGGGSTRGSRRFAPRAAPAGKPDGVGSRGHADATEGGGEDVRADVTAYPVISRRPVVPVEDSIQPDGIVCLIDGLKRKMLHRHLKSKYGMSPDDYRAMFDLPQDYPMTAPGYSKVKSEYAKRQGLGTEKNLKKVI